MSSIIRPPKPRKNPDPFIAPVHGTHGPCALCKQYAKLTENHIPPQAVGNFDRWRAHSYMTRVTANEDTIFGRSFPGGVRFRTLCAECNNGLGAVEDRALIDFYERVTKIAESPFHLPGLMRVPAKPNLIVRDLLAHMVSANDTGIPSPFDIEARNIFFNKMSLRLSTWNLFYWLYVGQELFLARSLFLTSWSPLLDVREMFILKSYPLAFLFIRKSSFYGLPNMMQFIGSRDEHEAELPIFVYRRENHPVWPAYTSNTEAVMFGSNAFGLVAQKG